MLLFCPGHGSKLLFLFKDNGGKLYFGVSDTTAGAIVAMTESEKAEYRIGISIDYTERMI